MTALGTAVAVLYQAPLDQFVTVRKRLCSELKQAGDRMAAAELAKFKRPALSVWAVNQLWWQERESFEQLLAAAARLSAGDLTATGSHRELMTSLRGVAARLLQDAGHAASEATLRRTSTTLSALAASGGFAPDPPGALQQDREPPGFEAVAFTSVLATTEQPSAQAQGPAGADSGASERERARAERQRLAQRREQQQAERRRLKSEIEAGRGELLSFEREAARLERDLSEARESAERARVRVHSLEARLADLAADAR